ncbi:Fanconi anemia group I protein [Smittium culicis]|uniref:Fanconi anemia group I protein n=1 Tax=Smittium culicis TaxID=133412 RepID=A0A1R1Y4M8_9FUNG|nr:Fanconi anemia group I protein [Smittium culicis]
MDPLMTKLHFIESFCEFEWSATTVTRIAAMYVEVSMPKQLRTLVVDKLISHMSKMQLNELPPLVYQIFLHSKQIERKHTISGIVDFFNSLEDTYLNKNSKVSTTQNGPDVKSILQVEGTVLLHIHFCVQQDHEWGTEILKYVKQGKNKRVVSKSSSAQNLSTFLLAMILNVGSISLFKENVFECLKSLLMLSTRDHVYNMSAIWGSGKS